MDVNDDLHLQKEEKNHKGENAVDQIYEKMVKLQSAAKAPDALKKVIYIIAGICVIIFVLLICVSILKANFSTESILLTLLAFFTILMSFVFYLKAVETSQKFYDSSYQFMKEISVLMGRMEERSVSMQKNKESKDQ